MPKRYKVTYRMKPYQADAYGGRKVTSTPPSQTTAWMAEPSYNKWRANHPANHYIIEHVETKEEPSKGSPKSPKGFNMMR